MRIRKFPHTVYCYGCGLYGELLTSNILQQGYGYSGFYLGDGRGSGSSIRLILNDGDGYGTEDMDFHIEKLSGNIFIDIA